MVNCHQTVAEGGRRGGRGQENESGNQITQCKILTVSVQNIQEGSLPSIVLPVSQFQLKMAIPVSAVHPPPIASQLMQMATEERC